MAKRKDWYYCSNCHEQGWVYHGESPEAIPDSKGECPYSSDGEHFWKPDKKFQNYAYTNDSRYPEDGWYLG